MNTIYLPQWLIRLFITVALPTVTCFGYYSLEFLGEDKGVWVFPVIMAYPAALIGIVGLFRTLLSSERTRLALSLWTLCIIAPISILLWVRT